MDKPATRAGIERRPIAARNLRVFQRIAAALASWRISPNAISIAGMLCAGIAATLLALTAGITTYDRMMFAVAAALIQLRLLANLLDGMVAIEGHLKSPTGELFNEVPDRISDVLVLVGAGYATGSRPELGWVAALLALFTAYVRVFGQSMGLPGDYCGPMAKQQRMFLITVACVVVAVMPELEFPWLANLGEDGQRDPMWLALALIIAGCIITVIRRLGRIVLTLNRK